MGGHGLECKTIPASGLALSLRPIWTKAFALPSLPIGGKGQEMNATSFTPANARTMAAKSVERRKQIAIERQYAANPTVACAAPNGSGLSVRADQLDTALEKLKQKLNEAMDKGESQDVLRYAQAIDRLEQSWARYAGVPVAPRKASRRTPSAPVEPLD